jgi:hypothetical protein
MIVTPAWFGRCGRQPFGLRRSRAAAERSGPFLARREADRHRCCGHQNISDFRSCDLRLRRRAGPQRASRRVSKRNMAMSSKLAHDRALAAVLAGCARSLTGSHDPALGDSVSICRCGSDHRFRIRSTPRTGLSPAIRAYKVASGGEALSHGYREGDPDSQDQQQQHRRRRAVRMRRNAADSSDILRM